MYSALFERIKKINRLFFSLVVIPTFLSTLYFGIFASDVYISESRFVVRSPEKPSTTGLGVILKTAGFSNASEEIDAAKDFVISRDALKNLDKNGLFAKAYNNSHVSIFDRFDPIGLNGSFEDLYKYYKSKVSVEHDASTTITKLTVKAFSPREAQLFNEQLLRMAEATVNRLNARGRSDLIKFSRAEVANAERNARAAALRLSAFRNREGIVDPEKEAQIQLQMISKLQDELIGAKSQLSQLRSFTPRNPQVAVLVNQIETLEAEIAKQSRMVAGDNQSLAATAAEYQRRQLEAQFADKQLTAALASLEEAQNEARRKQAYVERIVEPNHPDAPLEPRRLRGIIATFLLGLIAWGVSSMLLAGVREHVA